MLGWLDQRRKWTPPRKSGGRIGLLSDRRGATLPVIAVGLIPMFAAVGAAIDLGRIYVTTSQMQNAVDAAALAGANAYDNASTTDPSGRRLQVINYYRDNFADRYMGIGRVDGETPIATTSTLLEPEFTLDRGISHTAVKATGDLPLTFMSLFGFGSHRIKVEAHAQFQPHPLEVMVVLDNTGSMNGQVGGTTKIAALKTAVKSFLNVLYQGADNQPDLAIGIINYTIAANVGSILTKHGVAVEHMPGFTDGMPWADGSNPMGWKGCVANDVTVPDLGDSYAARDDNAYDIWNGMPGERPRPGTLRQMAPIRPFLYPPSALPQRPGGSPANPNAHSGANPTGGFHTPTGNINLFPARADLETVANSATYKRFFYRLYIGLNNGAGSMDDDVIVHGNGTASTYYDPNAIGAFDPVTGQGADFHVRTDLIPAASLSNYRAAAKYVVTSNNATAMPSPNWQCPQPGMDIAYNVPRATYTNYVDKHVWAVQPANGTMHHTGFIWGWRLLSRYDVFKRTKPTGAAAPTRALVFMTDGETALNVGGGQYDRVSTAYGTVIDGNVTARVRNDDNRTRNNFINQVDLRFARSCAIANSTVFPDSGKTPQIYVVAINGSNDIDSATSNRLRACGASGYWLTTTPNDLNTAFSQIARTLIDVHLTR